MAKLASEQTTTNGRKVVGFGKPKGSGKTTFYTSAAVTKKPMLIMQFDLGSITLPPGVNPNDVYIQDYPDDTVVNLAETSVKRKREVGDRVAKDLVAVLEGFKTGKDIIKFSDNTTVPRPNALFFDGAVRLDEIIVDLICAINGIADPTDMPSKSGSLGGGTMKFYSDRLNRIRKLFTMIISLPIDVYMATWEDAKHKKDTQGNILSSTYEPDLGGKLNILGPGMFDSCLYHYNDAGRYMVRTKPTPEIGLLGVRGKYGLASPIDVTIKDDDKSGLTPYQKVFGAE